MIRQLLKACVLLVFAGARFLCGGETFLAGTNQPGQGTNYSFTLTGGVTNLSLVISNSSTAYSHLFLKQGGVASDSDHDFVSRLDGASNFINLELPEFALTNYDLRVSTPAGSVAHDFTVVLTTNRTDLRSAEYPVLKPIVFSATGTLADAEWQYFQVDVPTNLPSGWRFVLSSTGAGNPDLYIRRNGTPTAGIYTKASQGQSIDTIVFTESEATAGTYFIGVQLPFGGGCNYTLSAEAGYLNALTWDPGLTAGGTEVFTNQSVSGGDYFFKITAQNTAAGAWRTALNVTSGEADVHLIQGSFSPFLSSYPRYSTRAGSDGLVLHSSEFSASQDWYIAVHATPGAVWTLVSGEAYAYDLGALAADASSGTNVIVGPEGMAFFKTTIPSDTLAWRLGLNGATNIFYVKKSVVPLPASYELTQPEEMLVVPDYLAVATFNGSYFVCVPGNPGDLLSLDSRKQAVTDISFGSNQTNVVVSGYGYVTYRVQVPVQQIAWQVTALPLSGDPSLAVRRDKVPNEFNNDLYSEVGGSVSDSVTLVPPALSDGSFYITVYGRGPYSFTLENGQPVITPIHYTSAVTNDDPGRSGWRYYALTNIAEQLGSLGWDLLLSNQVPGTEIALRRNAVPGRWNYRNNNIYTSSSGYVDNSGTAGFLQRPGHQADIWYVGVYTASTNLGPFVLQTQPLDAVLTNFDAAAVGVLNQPVGKWKYFRVNVPTNTLGWDVRIVNVTGSPQLHVCRDVLPPGNYNWNPIRSTSWPSGYAWIGALDWTGYNFTAGGAPETSRMLAMGLGNPLEAGTYYIGVLDPGSVSGYTLVSRGIGNGWSIPIIDLGTNWVFSTNGVGLAPREAAYYRVVVPSNAPSWKVKLTPTVGDALLLVQQGFLPNVGANTSQAGYGAPAGFGGQKMKKEGNEHWVLMPENDQTNIVAGEYFFGVVSEGVNPDPDASQIGTGNVGYTLSSVGPLPVVNLGTLTTTDLLTNVALEGGEIAAFRFTVTNGTSSLEARLENRAGNPGMTLQSGASLPRVWWPANSSYGNGYFYGNWGGQSAGILANYNLITAANPTAEYRLLVFGYSANDFGYCCYPNATNTLRIHPVVPTPLSFDGGSNVVVSVPAHEWRYFRVNVPTNAVGWDVRIVNVTGNPQMRVCHDVLPPGFLNWNPNWSTSWPTGYEWAGTVDWTSYQYTSGGVLDNSRMLAMGGGNPLEAGAYYIGVQDTTGNSSYTLVSRGIGSGLSIPLVDLGTNWVFSTNGTGLAPREAAYYRVVIPSNAPSWKVKLTPTVGDVLLLVQQGHLPNVGANTVQVGSSPRAGYGGQKMKKEGNEHWVLMPEAGQTNIPAGEYFLGVVSEGVNPDPNLSWIGTGSVSYTISSVGPMPVLNLGVLGATDLLVTNVLEGGEAMAFGFTVSGGTLSLETRLENRQGNPGMTLRAGSELPRIWPPAGSSSGNGYYYGNWGGEVPNLPANYTLNTLANPAAGEHRLLLFGYSSQDSGYCCYPDGTNTLRIHAVVPTLTTFDGGSNVVASVPANEWRYFRVEVPTNALGWDVRIVNVTGDPQMRVCRDVLPPGFVNWTPTYSTSWPTGYEWAGIVDWTGYNYTAGGALETSRMLAMGRGNPLEDGTYYIGVLDTSGVSSYTLVSRGIGGGLSIPVVDLGTNWVFSTNGVGLAPREAAYYRVVVPSNAPSWKLKLTPTLGDALLLAQAGYLPNAGANAVVSSYGPRAGYGGQRMKKEGNEHWVLTPENGQTNIPAGEYFFAVVSEGVNPDLNQSQIGTNDVSYTLSSVGPLPVVNLGTLTTTDLLVTNSLEGGEIAAYRFTVTNGTQSLETRLENRGGNPGMTLRSGAGLPQVTFSADSSYGYGHYYGNWGGQPPYTFGNFTLLTAANPAASEYQLLVFGYSSLDYGYCCFPNGSYTLRVTTPQIPPLNFTASQNTNGLTNAVSGLLADNQRAFYRITVPSQVDGAPVLGWKLDLNQTNGLPSVRVRKDALPEDAALQAGTTFAFGSATITPPYLTPGTWYVEVKGGGSTDFTLISSVITTNTTSRAPWTMPALNETNVPAGLSLPVFGDTGVDASGSPLPADQGVDLEQGQFHYYAIVVPTNNAGLLRTELQAISGNPNLYLRAGAAPTFTHYSGGCCLGTTLVDRSLTSSANTEYGNWVPLDGKNETQLTPGLWVIGVHAAGNSNVRYRLRLSCGNAVTNGLVQDLDLNGGSIGNQSIAGSDWRYYRVQIPSNAPVNWTITWTRSLGGARLSLRDTVPPGDHTTPYDYDSYFSYHFQRDWFSDGKNQGPYPRFDSPGVCTLTTPPLRPGSVYYIGFWSLTDSTFDLASSTGGGTIDVTNVVPFYLGYISGSLPANSTTMYRIEVPFEGTRLKFYATNDPGVVISVEQGTLAQSVGNAHWRSFGANSTLNMTLTQSGWPWRSGFTYFLAVTNGTGSSQTFNLLVDGRNVLTEDEDGDGLPDPWELLYFGNTYEFSSASDPDADGVSNFDEFQNGSSPVVADAYMFTQAARSPEGVFSSLFVGPTNGHYRVELKDVLEAGPWTLLRAFTNFGGSTWIYDSNAAAQDQRFYRAVP